MSFVNRMLASFGVGSATVDAQLESTQLNPGGSLKGKIVITGGKVEQAIDSIYLFLMTQYTKEVDDRKVTQNYQLGSYKITEQVNINPGEVEEIPFSFELPIDTPISIGQAPVWIKTGLDIKNAVDPVDQDFLQIQPTQEVGKVLSALDEMGFVLRKSNCVQAPRWLRNKYPFVQEFEFIPRGKYSGDLDELEVIFSMKDNSLEVMLEIDKRGKGLLGFLEEAMDADEKIVRFRLTGSESTSAIASTIGQLIRQNLQ
jgi:sporulation-control protein